MPSTDPPAGSGGASVVANPAAPSPSEAEPFEFACPCLNVSVESLCPNNQREAVKAGKAGKIQVYLPKGSEKIVRSRLVILWEDLTAETYCNGDIRQGGR